MSVDVEQATARDPLRPTLLHLLRTTMTPDSDAITDAEADALGEHVEALTPDEFRRLLFLGMSVVSLASPQQLGELNLAARRVGLPIRAVMPR